MTESKKAPTQRQLRVGELLRQALSDIIMRGDLYHPDLEGRSITVSEVRVSPDLKNATLFVYPLGGGETDTIKAAMEEHGDYIRRQIGKKVYLKHTPRLHFKVDDSFEKAQKVHDILRRPEVQRDLESSSES